jgi:glutaredoxin
MILYSLPGCGKCNVLKEKLTNKKLSFTIIEDVKKLKENGIMTLPVLEVEGKKLDYYAASQFIGSM